MSAPRLAIVFVRRLRIAPGAAAVLLAVAPTSLPARRAAAQSATPEPERVGLAPVLGVHAGAPQQVSLTLGVGRWQYRAAGERTTVAFAAVEPGLGAGRVSVGYFRGHGSLLAGAAVRASALRTWRDPWSVAPNRTYVGLEVSGHAILSARLGLFHRTSSASGGPLLFTWDVGLLF